MSNTRVMCPRCNKQFLYITTDKNIRCGGCNTYWRADTIRYEYAEPIKDEGNQETS